MDSIKDFISAGSIRGKKKYDDISSKIKENKEGLNLNLQGVENVDKSYEECCLESFTEDLMFISDNFNYKEETSVPGYEDTKNLFEMISKSKTPQMQFLGLETFSSAIIPPTSGKSNMNIIDACNKVPKYSYNSRI